MVVKVYISGISGNKEVKKRQQRVILILDSKNVKYEVIDIAEPDNEQQKDFMQTNSTSSGSTISDPTPRHPLPPQIFNDEVYCGDYDQFDMANEIDEMEKFLKLAPDDSLPTQTSNAEIKLGNGDVQAEQITKDQQQNDDENVVDPDNSENKHGDEEKNGTVEEDEKKPEEKKGGNDEEGEVEEEEEEEEKDE